MARRSVCILFSATLAVAVLGLTRAPAWGAIRLTLSPGRADYQFVAVQSKDGTPNGVRDSGSVPCH